jgi:hypothetical protein
MKFLQSFFYIDHYRKLYPILKLKNTTTIQPHYTYAINTHINVASNLLSINLINNIFNHHIHAHVHIIVHEI